LFEAFAKSGLSITPHASAPPGANRIAVTQLPVSLRRFSAISSSFAASAVREPAPQIIYPPEGARVDLGAKAGDISPLTLKLQGGRAPFRWLANGKPLEDLSRKRISEWTPDGVGYSTLTVIDAIGRAATVRVFVE
jgi:penicillin-binding protein 1C